jgi:hypothetical protein
VGTKFILLHINDGSGIGFSLEIINCADITGQLKNNDRLAGFSQDSGKIRESRIRVIQNGQKLANLPAFLQANTFNVRPGSLGHHKPEYAMNATLHARTSARLFVSELHLRFLNPIHKNSCSKPDEHSSKNACCNTRIATVACKFHLKVLYALTS